MERAVVQERERLPHVSLEPGSLAAGGGVEVGGRVAADTEVGRHLLDPEVVPWIRHQEGGREAGAAHERRGGLR